MRSMVSIVMEIVSSTRSGLQLQREYSSRILTIKFCENQLFTLCSYLWVQGDISLEFWKKISKQISLGVLVLNG